MTKKLRCPNCYRLQDVGEVSLDAHGFLDVRCPHCDFVWPLVNLESPGPVVEDKQRVRGELDPEREIIRCERRPKKRNRCQTPVPVKRGRCCICRMPVIVAKTIAREEGPMADKSGIEWTDATWNPIRGNKGKWHSTKVSEGCRNCYAERMNIRFGGPAYVKGADTLRLDEKVLEQPLRWKKPRMVFVGSMTDLFHEDVPDEWIDQIFAMMVMTPQHTFQVLTKRAGRLAFIEQGLKVQLPNVWLGVSVEDQAAADKRIPLLLKTPAAVRFVSCEPLLGAVDIGAACDEWWQSQYQPFWVICGGESGPHARPMHSEWARSLRDQCVAVGVPFFFKQWGAWRPTSPGFQKRDTRWVAQDGSWPDSFAPGAVCVAHLGKKAAGRQLDGRLWDQMPTQAEPAPFTLGDLRVEHQVGNEGCVECWDPYPVRCECGGLIHAMFGDENANGDYWLYTKCDECGEEEPDE